MNFDSQFAAVIKASRAEVYRSYNGPAAICEKHFTMQFQMFQFMDLYSYIIHDPQSSNTFHQFFFFEGMRWSDHDMHFHTTGCGPNDTFDDHEVLVSFILNKKGMSCVIDEFCYACTTVNAAPYEPGVFPGI